MQIGLFRREHLQSGNAQLIGDAAADQFQRTHGAITAWQQVEHTDDGHHTNITAESITVSPGGITSEGPITSGDGGFSGEDGNVGVGDLPNAGTPLQSGGYGIRIGPWRIISDPQNSPSTPTYPGLIFQMLNEGLGNFLFRFIRLGTFDYAFAPQTGLSLALGWGANRLSNVITAALSCVGLATVGSLVSNNTIAATGDITGSANVNGANMRVNPGAYYELARSVPLGYWQDVPFNTALFYTSVAGTGWLVSAGNVQTNRYTVIGKTLIWTLYLNATSIIGAPTQLLAVIPGGFASAVGRGAAAVGQLYDGAYNKGLAYVAAGGVVAIQKDPAAAFTPNTNATYVIMTIVIDIS